MSENNENSICKKFGHKKPKIFFRTWQGVFYYKCDRCKKELIQLPYYEKILSISFYDIYHFLIPKKYRLHPTT